MLTILSNTFRTAARQENKFPISEPNGSLRRAPISDRQAIEIERMRNSLHYRAPW